MTRYRIPIIHLLIIGLLSVTLTDPAAAENGPGDKLERGLINCFTGWIEIPKHAMHMKDDAGNPVSGALYGTLYGAGQAVARTGYGALDTMTFFMPDYDRPAMKAQYAWSDWDREQEQYAQADDHRWTRH